MKKYIMLVFSLFLILITVSCGKEKPYEYSNEGKVLQSYEILGNVKRKLPEVSNEGLARYPEYNVSFDGTQEEKEAIANENKLLNASNTTYNSMDEAGNLYLDGNSINRKLYKHSASIGLYGGNVNDDEKAVIKKINITPRNLGNYITGLYAPAGEVIKIEISEKDLKATGGFGIWIGNAGNRSSGGAEIPLEKTFSRMPYTVNEMRVSEATTYVGSYLGGAIYLGEPKNKNASYSVTISGAVEYSHFILGLTTKEEFDRLKDSSAPYFDLEVWDDAIRHSGPKYTLGPLDYDNIYQAAKMWEKISLVTNQVPSASANVGISMRYDTYIPAGAAVAFVGANFCVLPIDWFKGSINYEEFTTNGMWGTIHEYNHHYQQYGAPEGGEVTNNAVSLLSYALYTKISSARSLNKNLDGWNAYTYANYPLELLTNNTSDNPIYSLESYATLIHSFGVDNFLKAIKLQQTKGEVDSWYKAWCEATHYDMTYYFEELCNYHLSNEAKSEIKSLNYDMFIPVGSIYQTKASYVDMTPTVRPYEINYQEQITIDINNSIVVPEGFSFNIVDIKSDTKGEFIKNNNGFTYKPLEDDFDSNKIEVTINLKDNDNKYNIKPITLTFELIQKEKKLSVTTYTYNDNSIYRNIALAEANGFSGYESVENSYSNSYSLSNLNKNTITVVEGKIYLKDAGKYRLYIKGKDNVFMYVSIKNNKNYELAAYLNSNSNYTNDNEKAYYDLTIKKPTYVYIKTITLSKGNDGYSDIGYGMFSGEDVKVSTISNKYILNNDSKYKDVLFETPNYYPRKYSVSNDLIDTKKFEIVDSTNFIPWDENYTLDKMLDGNINTYAHNNSIISEPVTIIIDMKQNQKFNYLEIFGKNHDQSHTPTTFNLYVGDDLNTLSLYKSFENMPLNNRSLLLEFNEQISSRYIKLVIKDTESKRYVAISKIDIGLKIPTSNLISVLDDRVILNNNWDITSNEYSNFAGVISSKNGYLKYEFEGSLFGLYGIVSEETTLKISIDGGKYQEINLDRSDNLNLIYLINNLENGKHTIELKVSDRNVLLASIIYS